MKFPFYKQLNAMDCGPTCLRMIARYYGKHYQTNSIRQSAGFGKEGVSLLGISEAAEKIGFRTRAVQLNFHSLTHSVTLPCILHWDQCHFVVLTPLSGSKSGKRLQIADPDKGLISLSQEEFMGHWASTINGDGERLGTALLLEPTPRFHEEAGEKEEGLSWKLILQYLPQRKWSIIQVIATLLIGMLLQMIFPFLTQSIVDTGINTQNLNFIQIILAAQLMLVFSRTIVDFIRTRLLLKISIIINISILSDFWIKINRLPLAYFDRYHTGDTMQRLSDNKAIQNFLTGPALTTLFSALSFFVFAIILMLYNPLLFLVFAAGSLLYFGWVRLFLHIRRKLNYQTFAYAAKEKNATLQFVQGMQEIRLNNAEKAKRWEWENIQAGIFKLNYKSLNYSQLQQVGALLINQSKDVFITFLVATLVINGELTLGSMLAVQYILGQLSSPIEQFVGFIQNFQDAKISMERLNEIHQLSDEEPASVAFLEQLPENRSLNFSNLSFAYPGAMHKPVLADISMVIPEGKMTAIVGASGSGKTTLLKLLLKFYDSYQGEIRIGNPGSASGNNFKYISHAYWRKQCGAVLQEGYIFNDTVASNIAVGAEVVDYKRLVYACKVANILEFIESMPNGFHTLLGTEGVGISQGQKQRFLIARAVYKNPEYLFLDEATNALDANNEKAIVEQLYQSFEGKTVIVVAHRLSTVKNADNIIVLHEGKIAESGTHEELSSVRGKYYELVKNQLELGN